MHSVSCQDRDDASDRPSARTVTTARRRHRLDPKVTHAACAPGHPCARTRSRRAHDPVPYRRHARRRPARRRVGLTQRWWPTRLRLRRTVRCLTRTPCTRSTVRARSSRSTSRPTTVRGRTPRHRAPGATTAWDSREGVSMFGDARRAARTPSPRTTRSTSSVPDVKNADPSARVRAARRGQPGDGPVLLRGTGRAPIWRVRPEHEDPHRPGRLPPEPRDGHERRHGLQHPRPAVRRDRHQVRRVDVTDLPTTAMPSGAATCRRRDRTLPNGTNSPGIAFSSDGYLYVSSSATATVSRRRRCSSSTRVGCEQRRFAITGDFGSVGPRDLQLREHARRAGERRRALEGRRPVRSPRRRAIRPPRATPRARRAAPRPVSRRRPPVPC